MRRAGRDDVRGGEMQRLARPLPVPWGRWLSRLAVRLRHARLRALVLTIKCSCARPSVLRRPWYRAALRRRATTTQHTVEPITSAWHHCLSHPWPWSSAHLLLPPHLDLRETHFHTMLSHRAHGRRAQRPHELLLLLWGNTSLLRRANLGELRRPLRPGHTSDKDGLHDPLRTSVPSDL